MNEEALVVGDVVAGRYELLEELGQGSFGTVWRARHGELDEDVAIKVLKPSLAEDEEIRQLFLRKARAIRDLVHRYAVSLRDIGRDPERDCLYCTMDLIDGQTLEQVFSDGPMSAERVMRLGVQLLDVLCAAHEKGLLHGSLTPGNLFLVGEGQGEEVRVLDFGIAEALNNVEQGAGYDSDLDVVPANLEYMSPEHAAGEALDARSDLYSVGAILFEALCGPRFDPSKTEPPDVAGREMRDSVLLAAYDVPRKLRGVILQALKEEADQRFPNADAFKRALEEVSTDLFVGSGSGLDFDLPIGPGQSRTLIAFVDEEAELSARLRYERESGETLDGYDPDDVEPSAEARPTDMIRMEDLTSDRALGIAEAPPDQDPEETAFGAGLDSEAGLHPVSLLGSEDSLGDTQPIDLAPDPEETYPPPGLDADALSSRPGLEDTQPIDLAPDPEETYPPPGAKRPSAESAEYPVQRRQRDSDRWLVLLGVLLIPFVLGALYLFKRDPIQLAEGLGEQGAAEAPGGSPSAKAFKVTLDLEADHVTDEPTIDLRGRISVPQTATVIARGVSVQVAPDGLFVLPGVALADGKNKIRVKVVPDAGKVRTRVLRVFLDRKPPFLELRSPAKGAQTTSDTITVEGRVRDLTLAQLTINEVTVDAAAGWFKHDVELPGLGRHEIRVVARDRAGHTTTRSHTVLRRAPGTPPVSEPPSPDPAPDGAEAPTPAVADPGEGEVVEAPSPAPITEASPPLASSSVNERLGVRPCAVPLPGVELPSASPPAPDPDPVAARAPDAAPSVVDVSETPAADEVVAVVEPEEPSPEPPDWYKALAASERPPLPLPDGVEFTDEPRHYLCSKDGSWLMWVRPGTFQMGSGQGYSNERPVHEVAITRGFFMGKLEVTWKQLQAWWRSTNADPRPLPAGTREDLPATGVSWNEARAYCAWAGLRLPSEAEWEYTARGDGATFPWGSASPLDPEAPRCNLLGDEDGYEGLAPGGAFPSGASPFGCMDMAGNVWEWVADRYGPYQDEAARNPTGPAHGSSRTFRGGGWDSRARDVRSAHRRRLQPQVSYYALGFRVAKSSD